MSMVESIASGVVGGGRIPPGIDFGDLVSWGVEGLIKAKRNFNPDKGAQFKSYAFYRIKGEILDSIRREWQYRNPGEYSKYRQKLQEKIADYAEAEISGVEKKGGNLEEKWVGVVENSAMVYLMTLDEIEVVSEKEGTRNPEIELVDENRSVLWEEVAKLPEDEKKIIELFYNEGMKQVEIAGVMSYSKSKVCRIHKQILERLKRRLDKRYNE